MSSIFGGKFLFSRLCLGKNYPISFRRTCVRITATTATGSLLLALPGLEQSLPHWALSEFIGLCFQGNLRDNRQVNRPRCPQAPHFEGCKQLQGSSWKPGRKMTGDFDVLSLSLLEMDSNSFFSRVSGSACHCLRVIGEAPDGLLRFTCNLWVGVVVSKVWGKEMTVGASPA